MSSAGKPKNAIERRIDEIAETWNEFAAQDEARMLRYLVDNDSARMLDLFLELQHEEASEIPDLFIRFSEPFTDPGQYGFALRQSLEDQYEEVRGELAAAEIRADWSSPPPAPGNSDIEAFLQAAGSLRRHYEGMMVHLVAVLAPARLADPAAWAAWLERLVAASHSPSLRFLVVDQLADPQLNELAERYPQKVVTVPLELNMAGAYQELLRAVPGNGPGFAFRRLFVALASAAAAGNITAASHAAQRALALAQQQNWPQMVAAVNMALGAAYFAQRDLGATLQCYRNANRAIAGQDDPAAAKLDLQTRFAEASVLVSQGAYEDAERVYATIAQLAAKHDEPLARVESCRMAAWCCEHLDEPERAWDWALTSLEAGEALDETTRHTGTLPYVGATLLRLIQRGIHADQEATVRQRLVQLVGPDWEQQLQPGANSS